MPRDTNTPTPAPKLSIAEMFALEAEDYGDDMPVIGLPPTSAEIKRTARTAPVADLDGLSKIWMLVGPGGAGKTVVARWLGGEIARRGKSDSTFLAALDPTNRTLAEYFAAVIQPPSSDAAETGSWLRHVLQFAGKNRLNGIMDFGGGDVSLARTIEATPSLADTMEAEGVGLIAAYVLTPRVDDLASLVTFEARGFRPRATVLILNTSKAANASAFDGIRRQPAYKAAIARGAVELWMPSLSQGVALRIEQARAQFHDAREGEAPKGRGGAKISLLERVEVREFMERMGTEFSAVEGWLPWR